MEFSLNGRVLGEENEVVNIQTERQRGCGRGVRGVGRVNDVTAEKAWIVGVLVETELVEDLSYLVVPVFRATAQTVKCFLQQPVFTLLGVWVTDRRFNDGDFIRRQYALTKGILAIALFESAPALDSHTGEETESVRAEDRSVLFRFRPDAIFVIAKDDDPRFGAVRA